MLTIHTDAAVKGNPGPAGIGIVITGDVYEQIAMPLEGDWDNHTAEFEAILQALTYIKESGWAQQFIFLNSDSKAAVDALQQGRSKNPTYQHYVDQIYELEKDFSYITIDWKSERANRGADQMAKQGLQRALKNK